MDDSINLEKLDLLRTRLGVSYKEARAALEMTGGDVVEALIYLENRPFDQKWAVSSRQWWAQIKEWVKEGNVTRIRVKKGKDTLADIPVSVGALGIAGALLSTHLAVLGALGAVTAVAAGCRLEVERKDGSKEWVVIDHERE
ncbi:MAG: DUF4342 domain-containing protein [Heliobacteriaceae bacterium]|nr:DUF4342 domain-containing protein [Heliobacteriaceae bacterium]MDD4586851.1 DUF4342 domain-containing protein [Heliobacteriaceae bacterium]